VRERECVCLSVCVSERERKTERKTERKRARRERMINLAKEKDYVTFSN
jgi:hypothetical protein